MPRIRPLTRIERMKQDMTRYMTGQKKVEKVTNEAISNRIGVSPQAVGRKIQMANMTYTDLVYMFDELKATDEDIIRLLRYKEA